MKFSKNVNKKKCAPKLIFFNEKKEKLWHKKLTLKVRNWRFSITWFRAGVDLPEISYYENVLFFTQLFNHLMCKLLKKSYMLSITYYSILFVCFFIYFSCMPVNGRQERNYLDDKVSFIYLCMQLYFEVMSAIHFSTRQLYFSLTV